MTAVESPLQIAPRFPKRKKSMEDEPPLELKVEPAVRSCGVDLAWDMLRGSRVDSSLNLFTVATRREGAVELT
jgi:hypothetical protein